MKFQGCFLVLFIVFSTAQAQPQNPAAKKAVIPPPQSLKPMQPYTPPGLMGLGANVLSDSSRRDPFRLPQYLINKLTYKVPMALAPSDPQAIDDRIEPIRRWNTSDYTLVGIIWEVKNPKALVRDIQNRVHVIRINDKVGNLNGAVTSIREGAVTVTEKDSPIVLRLKK